MDKFRLGIIHPGAMGISVAASAQNSGHDVSWASAGRSEKSIARAAEHQLRDVKTLESLCQNCNILVSVCPPHAADDVADLVISHAFNGLYLDANAISPQKIRDMGERMRAAGVAFVDGGIIGGPAWEPGATTLYVSGKDSIRIADCFSAGPLAVSILGDEVGTASALKMCYAAWTKGRTALLCGIMAAAEQLEVWEALAVQWERDWPGFSAEAATRVPRVTAKAWRFAGEMEEIAATFAEVGLPDGFHLAAGDLYRRMAHYKNAEQPPDLRDVLRSLLVSGDNVEA
jgi:3-hydroxyisobutyrate dehydrogenase-like beta-hydroxyacid dehydrogenase